MIPLTLTLTSSPSVSLSLKPRYFPSLKPIHTRYNQLKKLRQQVLAYTRLSHSCCLLILLFPILWGFCLLLFRVCFDLGEVEEWQVQGGTLDRRAGGSGNRRLHFKLVNFSGDSSAGGCWVWVSDWFDRRQICRYGNHWLYSLFQLDGSPLFLSPFRDLFWHFSFHLQCYSVWYGL